jgi:hypothetical protein
MFGAAGSAQIDCPVQMHSNPQSTHCRFWQVSWSLQLAQGAPAGPPQAVMPKPDWHVPSAAQQPSEHVCGPQTAHCWPRQSWPWGHASHAAPPRPQEPLAFPGRQCPFASQQPLGQLTASQTHWSFWQR